MDDRGIDRITTDPERLVQLARASPTHGFTDSGCQHSSFSVECPTLTELAGRRPDPGHPDGEFNIAWSPDELQATLVARIEDHFDGSIWDDQGVQRSLSGFAREIAGAYTLRLQSGRFELLRDAAIRPVCAGSIRYDAPRLSLLAERGSFCYPSVIFEGDVTIEDDELRVDPDTMRAEFPSIVLFGTRALERSA